MRDISVNFVIEKRYTQDYLQIDRYIAKYGLYEDIMNRERSNTYKPRETKKTKTKTNQIMSRSLIQQQIFIARLVILGVRQLLHTARVRGMRVVWSEF